MSRSLAHSEVLLLDCQTTGANPARGQLIEIAWCRTSAEAIGRGDAPDVHSFPIALEAGRRVPRRITALTGITAEDLADAPPAQEVWAHVRAALDGPATLVAHVARFERAFVDDLRHRFDDGQAAELDWICTHEVVCRLLPGLPHRGLKAVAGHLGHVVCEGKRAAAHVLATCDVWAGLVQRLDRDVGVTTFDDLRTWIDETTPARRVGREFSVAKADRLALPDTPGVYRMLGSREQVLYVGKATSLRRRVNSYFQKRRHAAARTKEMLAQVAEVDVTATATALEAALHECDAIKRHAPPYNVALRGRGVEPVFSSPDLASVQATPDTRHRLGPLPGRGVHDAWQSLAALLAGAPPADEAEAFRGALGLPETSDVDLDIARAGLITFVDEYVHGPVTTPLHRRLRGLGAREWRAYRETLTATADDTNDMEEEVESEDIDDATTDADAPRELWSPGTPEQVVRLFLGSARRGAHLLRRACWLRQLSECTLVWSPPVRGARDPWRLIAVAEGRVTDARDVPPQAPAPPPAAHARTAVERGAAIDVATYDRLRVLTTEIRRVLAASRPVELCLTPRHRLDHDALARRLFWL